MATMDNYYSTLLRTRPQLGNNSTTLTNAWDDLTASQGAYGDTATQAYLSHALAFDPTQAINTYAQGAWNQAAAGMNDTLTKLKGSAVGAGRLDTGFFDEDQGQVYRDTVNHFSDALSQQALNAAQLQLQNNNTLENFGQERTNMYADMLASRREQQINDEREQAAAKKKKKSGIGGLLGKAIGGIGGFILGGPAGAATGYKVGGELGAGIGGL